MTDKERLMEILKVIGDDQRDYVIAESEVLRERLADALLQHGVTLPPEQEEPTPTEMVKALLEKGWTIEFFDKEERGFQLVFRPETKEAIYTLEAAYRRAFPRKRKIMVDAWYKEGMIREFDFFELCDHRDWIPGTATFEVPEEEIP